MLLTFDCRDINGTLGSGRLRFFPKKRGESKIGKNSPGSVRSRSRVRLSRNGGNSPQRTTNACERSINPSAVGAAGVSQSRGATRGRWRRPPLPACGPFAQGDRLPRWTAGVFGPRYAPPLQAVVNHAERFSELLAQVGLRGAEDDRTRAWLTHRREEFELVLALIVGDWADSRIGLAEAARAAALYLDDLHAGARRCLGLGPALGCCSGESSPTVIAADVHRAITRPVVEKVFRSDPGETWVDPGTLLEGLDVSGWPSLRHRPYRPIKKGKS